MTARKGALAAALAPDQLIHALVRKPDHRGDRSTRRAGGGRLSDRRVSGAFEVTKGSFGIAVYVCRLARRVERGAGGVHLPLVAVGVREDRVGVPAPGVEIGADLRGDGVVAEAFAGDVLEALIEECGDLAIHASSVLDTRRGVQPQRGALA
jgi:hypothetical protein